MYESVCVVCVRVCVCLCLPIHDLVVLILSPVCCQALNQTTRARQCVCVVVCVSLTSTWTTDRSGAVCIIHTPLEISSVYIYLTVVASHNFQTDIDKIRMIPSGRSTFPVNTNAGATKVWGLKIETYHQIPGSESTLKHFLVIYGSFLCCFTFPSVGTSPKKYKIRSLLCQAFVSVAPREETLSQFYLQKPPHCGFPTVFDSWPFKMKQGLDSM